MLAPQSKLGRRKASTQARVLHQPPVGEDELASAISQRVQIFAANQCFEARYMLFVSAQVEQLRRKPTVFKLGIVDEHVLGRIRSIRAILQIVYSPVQQQ